MSGGRRVAALAGLLLAASAAAAPGAAQSVPRVVLGWGVDTATAAWSEQAWHAAVPEIVRLWRAYLTSAPEQQQPTDRWSAREQALWPVYDHTAGTAYKGFPATILDVRPVAPDTFVIRTLFASAAGDSREVRPVALTRVYAFRENGRWVLGSALVRHTDAWHATSLGAFRFLTPPSRPLDRSRAARTVAFADSLADAFGVDRLHAVTYVVADGTEALHRLMGIDWTFGALGHGYALPGLVLSGDPDFGEENRHEVAHLVLQPLLREGRTHGLVGEGIAVWFGGSSGRPFRQLVAEYAHYLDAHPDVSLDLIMEGASPDRGWGPAGAVLVDLVFARRGTAGLRELLNSGRSADELRQKVASLLGVPWTDVAAAWRQRVARLAESRGGE